MSASEDLRLGFCASCGYGRHRCSAGRARLDHAYGYHARGRRPAHWADYRRIVPREFKGSKDWGKTTRITSGVRSYGNFFDFNIHRKTSEVNDGVWKKYRLTLVEPEKNLTVRIDNLHSIDSGKHALTLFVAAKVHGWAGHCVRKRRPRYFT